MVICNIRSVPLVQEAGSLARLPPEQQPVMIHMCSSGTGAIASVTTKLRLYVTPLFV